MIKVQFTNIGQALRKWEAELDEFSPRSVLRELRYSYALHKLPDIMWNAVAQSGTVWIHGRSYAGKFKVVM